jgi:1-deoxy-D-xylulose-5-phosphate synthase
MLQVASGATRHRRPVPFVLVRGAIPGDDGASHHGMLDLAYLRLIPGMTVSAPSSPDDLRQLLATALASGAPFALRYPRGAAPNAGTVPLHPLPIATMNILRRGDDIALLAVGKMVGVASAAAAVLDGEGISCTVVDARFIKPLDPAIPAVAARHSAVLTIEDGTVVGGFGDAVLEALAEAGVSVPLRRLGLPDSFIEHGAQPLLLHKFGLDCDAVATAAREMLSKRRPSVLAG